MSIETVDADYKKREPQWRRCRDAFEGSDAVKARGRTYLPSIEAHSPAEYDDYVTRAHFLPVTERSMTMLVGLAFRKNITKKLPARMRAEVERHMKDVTLSGEDLDQVSAEMLREVLLTGRHGVLLAYSRILNRPWLKTYKSEDILSREYLRMESGIIALAHVVLREFRPNPKDADKAITVLFEHYLVGVIVGVETRYEYRIQKWIEITDDERRNTTTDEAFRKDGDPVVPLRMEQPLDRIPFVIPVAIGTGQSIPKPPMLDMVDVNLSHFRNSADREHGAYWTARPTPWITGHANTGERLTVGGNKAWVISEADARVGMLEYQGKGLSELKDLMQEKEQHMAVLGARMLETQKRAAETAESLRLRAAESSASLNDVVVNVSKALTMIMWLHLWWFYGDAEPNDSDVDVQISRDYLVVQMDPQMLTALVTAVQGGQMSYATFYHNLEKGELTRPGITAVEEKEEAAGEMEEEPAPAPPTADLDDTLTDEQAGG